MKFCTNCDNMYYIKINENNTNQLEYYCRYCKHVDTLVNNEGICIINNKTKQSENTTSSVVNEYTKLDPTLPRLYNLKCPNVDCNSNQSEFGNKNPEIIYIRIDDSNLKYLYLCSHCDFTWKTNAAII